MLTFPQDKHLEKSMLFFCSFLEQDDKIFAKGSGNTVLPKEETGCGKFGAGLFKTH